MTPIKEQDKEQSMIVSKTFEMSAVEKKEQVPYLLSRSVVGSKKSNQSSNSNILRKDVVVSSQKIVDHKTVLINSKVKSNQISLS